jgi:hypothetical protein
MSKINFKVLSFVIMIGSLLIAASAMAQSNSSNINKLAYAKNDGIVDKTSEDKTPVPGMEVSFQAKGAAVVRFCADGNMFGTGTGSLQLSAEMDGVQLGKQIQFFTSNDGNVVPRCFDWIADDLEPGTHTVIIFWELLETAELTGRFHASVLTILYQGR